MKDLFEDVLELARAAAMMRGQPCPLAELDQWGLRFTDGRVISFTELAREDFSIDAVVRVAGGFYEHRGQKVSPNWREANRGWQQTSRTVVPEDKVGVIALVVDTPSRRPRRFLVEFREEPFATNFEGQVIASCSAVCSYSNLTGAHGYQGDAVYRSLLDNLVEVGRTSCPGDPTFEFKSNDIVVLRWEAKSGCELPNIGSKHYAWVQRGEMQRLLRSGLATVHLHMALNNAGIFIS